MLITRLELENITTHRRTMIDFARGVNILAGKNGTGKSSVLRMIGLSLFDCYAKDTGRFKRDVKQESGEAVVKIYISTSENDTYRIIRTLGKTKGFEIQVQTGTKFKAVPGIKTKEDYRNWLKEKMNLNIEYNLETLFDNAVGVEQGTFTAPFLQPPSVRIATFAPIINVEIYDKLYKNYLPIIHEFEAEFNQIEQKKAKLDGEISFKDQFIKENQELQTDLYTTEKQHLIIKNELKEITQQYDNLSILKNNLESLNTFVERLKGEVNTYQAKLSALQQNIDKSEQAKNICNKLNEPFIIYGQNYEKQKRLQKQNQVLQDYKTQEMDLKQKISRIQGLSEKISQDIVTIENIKPEYGKLQKDYYESQKIQKQWEENQKKISRINTIISELNKKQQKVQDLQKKISNLNSELKKQAEIKKEFSKLEEIQIELTNNEKKISAIESEINQLTENKIKSKDGMCPFLHEQCKNIQEQSLETYFEKLITDRTKQLKEYQNKLRKVKEIYQSTKEMESELKRLDKIDVQKAELQEQNSILQKEIAEMNQEIAIKPLIDSEIQKLSQVKEELEPLIKKFHAYHDKIEKDLPQLLERQHVMKDNMHEITQKLSPLLTKIEELKEIPMQLEEVSKKLDELKPQYEEYQKNIKYANQLNELKQQYNEIQINMKKINEELNEKNGKLIQLNKNFNQEQFNLITIQKEELNRQEAASNSKLSSIQQQLENLKTKIDKILEKEKELAQLQTEYERLMRIHGFSTQLRNWFKDAGPLITEAVMKQINSLASILFRGMINQEAAELIWEKDYELKLKTPLNLKSFNQLSGGEQMAAALSIRLAILQIMANVGFAFFDEPTTNLDAEKRTNLSQSLRKIQGFDQLFVISHDDTFESMGDFLIRFEKDENEETKIIYSN